MIRMFQNGWKKKRNKYVHDNYQNEIIRIVVFILLREIA